MSELCTRRRRWLWISASLAVIGTVAVTGLEVWITFLAPHALAAARGIALVVPSVGIAASGAVVAILLRITETPILTAALELLDSKPEPALRIVNSNDRRTS